jgi:hypothetical protein
MVSKGQRVTMAEMGHKAFKEFKEILAHRGRVEMRGRAVFKETRVIPVFHAK